MPEAEPLPTALPYLDNESDVIDTTTPEEVTPTPPAPDVEAPEEAPPADEPAPQVEEPATPAAPGITDQFQKLMEMQQQNLELQRQQLQPQPAQPQQYVPLQARPEWQQKYDEALTASSYDENARRTLREMNQELIQEQVQQAMAPMQQRVQMEMRSEAVLRSSFAATQQQFGSAVSQDDFMAVAQEVFGNDRAALAQALDPTLNPSATVTQKILAEAAAGRAFLAGRLKPAATPTPPPAPRGGARTITPTATPRSAADQWNDPDYLNSIDLYDLARRNR